MSNQVSTYRQALREQILQTAMEAFAEKGIRAVKMDNIARRLSISKRTLYEVYEKKEDLLFEGIKKYKAQNDDEIRAYAESHNVLDLIVKVYYMKIEEFRAINPLFYTDLAKYPRVVEFLEEDKRTSRSKVVEFFERGIKEGYFRDSVNYEMIPHLFDGLGLYIMKHQLYREYSIKQIFDNMLLVALRGFCTERGISELEARLV